MPTCNPIDPVGTAELLDQLDAWFNAGLDAGETDSAHIDEGVAILDRLTPVAGVAFTAQLTVHLATAGLAHLAEAHAARADHPAAA